MNANEPVGGWAGPAAPRIRTPAPEEQGALFRSVAVAARGFGRPKAPDVFAVMNIHRSLFWGWLAFASRLMPFGKLSGRDRELVILRTAWNCRSRYEWGQHVELGLRVGLTDAAIARIRRGPEAAVTPREALLLATCDELHANRVLGDATWSSLRAEFDEATLIELTLLIGHYAMLAAFLTSAGIALEPSVERCLAEFDARTR
jgi:alkylhydroperoxidase family enzyme